ncbi:putative flagellum transition zone component [Leishmania major strain Friedlin]|uniref:Putative flagellum transition zone component n=1 Tax=Leishmania major TaxID=5664 RepID=Q4Q0D8_LEIMA|nr:putative flagellum transition zone component [Leishmania major strain Friedlin]CAG9584178.1 flagellum_transition_zone_component_-_putative [Leishmania major strain Friedlin]CAJ09597.1 putative flagellum transition zone component [Leishmania major strain Friedlin]|eukprot:XP_001687210.1 putative flagellum transition zone component [Leishmania major strain Friedlin]
MSAEHHLCPAETAEEGIYTRSPLTATEEATQLLPGSRFLSTMEFKRIYLGGGTVGDASTAATARCSSTSPPGTFAEPAHLSSLFTSSAPWGTHASPSPHVIRAPRKPATDTAARFHRKGDDRGTARQLRYLYGGAGGRIRVLAASETHTSSSRRTAAPRPSADEHRPYSAKTLTSEAPQVVAPATLYSAHTPLPHQLRSRVHSARRATSPSVTKKFGAEPLPRSQPRTEDAWFALTRELMNTKSEVQNLQQQLQHAHVLLRSLHGITDNTVDEGAEAADADAIAAVDTAAAVATSSKSTSGSAPEVSGPSSELPRPREYWQRRAYFLMKQNEELQAESDRLRRDSRSSKVRALLQELQSVRGALSRYRRKAGVAAAPSLSAKELASESGGPEADLGIPPHDDGKLASSPLAPRLTHRGGAASSLEPAVDDAFLHQKDDAIRGLQERLRLLTRQYEQTDARLIETTRELEDMTHRHCAMQVEWKALVELPQELARTQQQLAVAQARLLDCDREVAAFHQVFDTQSSPATLRAIIDERDHLVELLQQSHESEAALRDEVKAAQQQTVQAMEKRYQVQCAEQHAMARDREAQQEETIQKLRKRVAALEHVLEVQRETYERQLAEYAEEREAQLTERLLESLRRPETGMESIALSAPRSLGTAASVRPTLPDGQPPTTGVPRLAACEASLLATPTSASSSLRCPSAEHAQTDPMLRTTSFLESVTSPCRAGGAATATAAQDDDASPTDRVAGKSTLSFMPDTADSNSSYDSLTGDSQDDVTSLSSASARQSRRLIGGSTSSTTQTRGGERVRDVTVRKELVDDCAAAATDEARVTTASSSSTDDYSDGEGSHGNDETVEKASGPDSGSSVVSSADSSLQLTSCAEGAAKQQQTVPNTISTAPTKTHSYVIDLPTPPIAVGSPVSILINRTTMTGPLFSSSVRAVVHSPDVSSQRTASAADLTHTQQTLPGISEATSSGSFLASSSTSFALDSPHSGDDDGRSPRADSYQSEPHGGPLQQMEKGGVAKFNSSTGSESAALAEAATRRMPSLPDPNVVVPLPTFPAGRQSPESEDAVATAPFAAAPRANEWRSSLSFVSSPGANAATTAHPRGGVPIPSPIAVTPAVASTLYQQRRSSSFMVTGAYSDDDFGGGGAGMGRGGVSSRMLSTDHSTTVDLTNQYSGSASFDFAGALAERHRLEDMQNAFLSFRRSSTANVAIGGDVSGETSAFPMEGSGNTNSGRFAVMGTGAVGLRKTPSPLGSDALEVSEHVLFASYQNDDAKDTGATAAISNALRQGEDRASGEGGSAGSVDVPYPDDDEDMTSSISADRVTAGTREREEAPLADALPYTAPTGGSARSRVPSEDALAAKSPAPEMMQSNLAVDAARDASSSPMAIASSLGSYGDLASSAKTPPPEEQAILSFGFEDVGTATLQAGDVKSAAPPAAAAITEAAAVPSFVPLPPRVAVPAPPST